MVEQDIAVVQHRKKVTLFGRERVDRLQRGIPKFVESARTGAKPVVFGDGRQTRDFVYVGNVVSANLRAAEAGGVAGFAYNVGCGEGITLLELLTALELLGGRLEPQFRPAREGEVRHSRARHSNSFDPSVMLQLRQPTLSPIA